MASFTIRVELHNADSDNYEELHKEMSGKWFRRTIISGDGVKYQLPDTEYNYSGETTRDDVLDKPILQPIQLKSTQEF